MKIRNEILFKEMETSKLGVVTEITEKMIKVQKDKKARTLFSIKYNPIYSLKIVQTIVHVFPKMIT